MADEPAVRRLNFRPGTPVRLPDGQVWSFPKPPESSAFDFEGFGRDYPEVLKAIEEAEDPSEQRRGELVLAVDLLDRNYDLRPAQLRSLLDCPSGGEEARRLQQAFAGLALEHLRRTWSSESPRLAAQQPTRRVRIYEALLRFARPRRAADPSALNLTSRTV